ncbi:MAG: XdhC family protein [Chloroflexota bacterium]
MKAVYEEAAALARTGGEFVLATVVHTQGSTPQKPGATLLVRADGSTVGTLGGGCVEGDIWFAAKEALRERVGPFFKRYYLNEDIAARDGLVCGGTMFFFIEPVLAGNPARALLPAIANAYDGGEPLAVATVVDAETGEPGARLVVREGGQTEGTLGSAALDVQAVEACREAMPQGKTARIVHEGTEVFVQGFTAPALLVLVGGGHVNLQVARIAAMMGFRVMVADDRREFASEERFPMAERTVVAPYEHCLDGLPITPNTAVVVGTRGHNFDDVALESAVRSLAGYVGLLGSVRKTVLIYQALLKRGVPAERLKQVHSPVGLDLGGRTPEEIALSIVAQLVAHRHGRSGGVMTLDPAQVDRLVEKAAGAQSPAR